MTIASTPDTRSETKPEAAARTHALTSQATEPYRPKHKVRIVTAASLFDGHDAAINIMRRILQATGAEVIHLGHDRSVKDIVDSAIQEDVQGIAVSSYQGGHMEFFRYMIDLLAEQKCSHIKVFGGGGGTIVPEEIAELQAYGVTRIYHPEDGRRMGLQGMINDIIERCDYDLATFEERRADADGHIGLLSFDDPHGIARAITAAEAAADEGTDPDLRQRVRSELDALPPGDCPVVGITGTGGAGKSSFVDEIVRRYLSDFPEAHVAVLSVDPTKKRTGGALLGDRIRMNSLRSDRAYMRSMATRGAGGPVSAALSDAIDICRSAGFDLVLVETSGIGQADSSIVELSDLSIYVMTPEFGAQTQLEKIEMIDMADMVVVNKFDKAGAHDALRDVRKAYQRAHSLFEQQPDEMPVYPTTANRFNDLGCNQFYVALLEALHQRKDHPASGRYTASLPCGEPDRAFIIPPRRSHYLSDISETVRAYKAQAQEQAELAAELWALRKAIAHYTGWPDREEAALEPFVLEQVAEAPAHLEPLMNEFNSLLERLDPDNLALLRQWPHLQAGYRAERNSYQVRGKTIEVENFSESLAHQRIPKVALPRFKDWGSVLQWLLLENVPGRFPYTAGVFPYKRKGEDPTRMFAGEGGPWRTNKRFHYLSRHSEAKRLSTAFDSVTLYGEDPDRRPDIWGKVGNSGVSIATVEDMEALYAGFDLTDPRTSVSMTINGPAPTMLAFYFNAAVRQTLRKYLKAQGKIQISDEECLQPGGGGYSFRELRSMVDDETYQRLVADTVCRVRGTVQADILKEDQAQNTCIFTTEFALKMMGDVQSWFTEHEVRNFYSVSISGYHIAEAGANPITQLAFTLANGFTYVEYYLARGMEIDSFAPNLSFFFSNGMDAEYAVIGRVARRIWATSMRELYGGNARSQKLKYHIQTSGRSLHAQEVQFNDIRTTLQALLAIYDNCNSLHTNAYDEAVTTPTEASVRRALAIQLIINHEFGVAKNENPNQGSFIIDELTELVEEAVLAEFDRLTERGGVLGAMERMYQRSKIQEESLYYEQLKHSGELPIMGVNTFLGDDDEAETAITELIRATDEEKEDQLQRLLDFQARHAEERDETIEHLKAVAIRGDNIFDALMTAVQSLSLGQITHALYEVGGQYRRSM
jgi:methylmalonyl-CoA mutase